MWTNTLRLRKSHSVFHSIATRVSDIHLHYRLCERLIFTLPVPRFRATVKEYIASKLLLLLLVYGHLCCSSRGLNLQAFSLSPSSQDFVQVVDGRNLYQTQELILELRWGRSNGRRGSIIRFKFLTFMVFVINLLPPVLQ